MSEELKKREPFSWWHRILLFLILTAVVLLSILIFLSYRAGRQLGAEIVKVGLAEEPLTFSDLEADIIQSSMAEDATGYYTEALFNAPTEELANLRRANTSYRDNITSLPEGEVPDDLREEITQSLASFQSMLEKLDKGADVPLSRFDIGILSGIKEFKTRLVRLQTAAFLLSLRTLDLIRRGEGDAAVASAISLLKMTRTFDLHPTLIVYASKMTFVLLACDDIRLLLEHSYPSEESLAKLQEVLSGTIAPDVLERALFAERVYQIEKARDLIPEDITSRLLPEQALDLPERLELPFASWMRLRLRRGSTQNLRDLAWLITTARRPWPEPLDKIVAKASESAGKSSQLTSSGNVLVHLTAETLVFVRCSLLAIAIERYHRAHSELPGSLDDISSTYIDSIPLDPFTGSKLHYGKEEETYVVYSVGINRQDDGGSIKLEVNEQTSQDRGLRIRHFSKTQ